MIKHPFKAYEGNEPYIFICYSHKDSESVYNIIHALNEEGFRVWYDQGCEPGYDWGDNIDEKIKKCRCFIAFISENMLQSRISRNELEIAADDMHDNNIKIIPLNLDDSTLTGKLNLQLHGIQQIRKSVYGEHLLEELIDALPPETCQEKNSVKQSSNQSAKTVSESDIAAISEGFIYRELKKFLDTDDADFTKMQISYSCIFNHLLENKDYTSENIFALLTDKFFGEGEGGAYKTAGLVSQAEGLDKQNRRINEEGQRSSEYSGRYFLKLSGVCGTGKSTFMQILYLSFLRKHNKNQVPIYYNLSFYENKTVENPSSFIIEDINSITEYFRESGKTPIFFIDGINTCLFSENPLDNLIYDYIKDIKSLQKIVCIEDNFTCNPERNRRDAYITNTASIELHFRPIDLIETVECEELIKCAEELDRMETGEGVLDYFKKNQFYEVDLFLIDKFALKLKYTDIHSKTIYDWFEDILRYDYRCDDKFLSAAAGIAFRYCYTNDRVADILNESEYAARAFSIMRAHKFFNDYLIARHYVEMILSYKEGDDVRFFEMVMPKQVTRFIVAKMNKEFLTEEKIQKFFTENYSKFQVLGKSEATFILGRFKSTNTKSTGKQALLKEYAAQKKRLEENNDNKDYTYSQYMDDLFLLRGISISLIGYGEKTVLKEYIESIIANHYANEINRGFHLEYYGDKIYIPGSKMLDYLDALDKGEKTMQYLCKGLDDFIFEGREAKTGEVMLFTLCSLIQARIEKGSDYKTGCLFIQAEGVGKHTRGLEEEGQRLAVYRYFDLKKYIKRAIEYIEHYRRNNGIKRIPQNFESELFDNYLKSVKRDFIDYNAGKNIPIEASFFNIYSDAAKIKRTGWVKSGIENPENIVEHSFNLMLMTLFFVPTKDAWSTFDKDKILKMLLIHDLTETVLGDIPKPDKQSDTEGKYDRNEDLMMKQLLLKGTYPSLSSLDEYYKLWEEFCEQKTDDARLAKDIDIIQAVYQFKKYYKKYPDNFAPERVEKWYNEFYSLKTDFGRELFHRLIIYNNF